MTYDKRFDTLKSINIISAQPNLKFRYCHQTKCQLMSPKGAGGQGGVQQKKKQKKIGKLLILVHVKQLKLFLKWQYFWNSNNPNHTHPLPLQTVIQWETL